MVLTAPPIKQPCDKNINNNSIKNQPVQREREPPGERWRGECIMKQNGESRKEAIQPINHLSHSQEHCGNSNKI